MARNVIILGAGASAAAGAPLMFDFLDAAEKIVAIGNTGRFEADFKLVFRALHELEGVLARSVIDVNNLEAVFGAFEMAKLCQRLGSLMEGELNHLTVALSNVILRTIELNMRHQGVFPRWTPPVGYNELGELLKDRPADIAFITFNYDLGLDHAVYNATGQDPDYGFGRKGGRPVLKLHGSLHWYKNGVPEGRLEAIPMQSLFTATNISPAVHDQNKANVLVSNHLASLGNPPPFIVPPTWKKGDHYGEIGSVWKAAADHLQEAEHIYVCGFSLPETDQYFRFLYALGTAGWSRIKSFVVMDPNPEVGDRFRQLLGPAVSARFQFHRKGFAHFVEWFRRNGAR
jgi:hypothetical protein